jgi:hypothetical protein
LNRSCYEQRSSLSKSHASIRRLSFSHGERGWTNSGRSPTQPQSLLVLDFAFRRGSLQHIVSFGPLNSLTAPTLATCTTMSSNVSGHRAIHQCEYALARHKHQSCPRSHLAIRKFPTVLQIRLSASGGRNFLLCTTRWTHHHVYVSTNTLLGERHVALRTDHVNDRCKATTQVEAVCSALYRGCVDVPPSIKHFGPECQATVWPFSDTSHSFVAKSQSSMGL